MQPPQRFARVIVDRSADREFDYLIPARLAGRWRSAAACGCPSATARRWVRWSIYRTESAVPEASLRPLNAVIGDKPIISPVLIELARWMADYYCCPVETAMRSVLPQVIRDAEVGRQETALRPPRPRRRRRRNSPPCTKRAPRQAEVLEALHGGGRRTAAGRRVGKACGATHQTIQSLVKAGFVETTATAVARDPYEKETFVANAKQTLTAEQDAALKIVHASHGRPGGEKKPVLLFGVTGSGKTEVYLQAIARALERGKTALVLVPEISLTPQTVERFKSRFASTQEQVAVLHSHLSAGERHDEWHKIHGGKARIVIGARSAVFAPLSNLGLIVVDEEHENSYKQEEAPRYQARDLAVLRARAGGLRRGPRQRDAVHRELPQRHDRQVRPRAADHARGRPADAAHPHRGPAQRVAASKKASPARALGKVARRHHDRLEKKEQTILFLNRRGFATSLVCPACGDVLRCVDCSVSLTFHRAANRLVCHLCGHQAVRAEPLPEVQRPRHPAGGSGHRARGGGRRQGVPAGEHQAHGRRRDDARRSPTARRSTPSARARSTSSSARR